MKPQERQITYRGWATRAPVAQTPCKACAKHAHAPSPRARTGLHDFHFVEFSHQSVVPVPSTSPVKPQLLKQQVSAPVKPQERKLTSCMARDGQHARPSQKHCKQADNLNRTYLHKSLNKYLRVVLCTMLTYLKLGKKWFII